MPHAKNGRLQPDRKAIDVEIARVRELDIGALRTRWHTVFGRRAPAHLPRHLLFRILAYRLQADHRAISTPKASVCWIARKAGQRAASQVRRPIGTVLGREWNGQMQRVTVLENGFAWKGKTYPSLSKIALAITGTRWNGPRFFGLRDKPSKKEASR